jgi:hypothetical protein
MPNPLHLLLHYLQGNSSLNTVIGNGKRFMAYDLVDALERIHEEFLLSRLQFAVRPKDRKKGKRHEVWKGSFDVKECRTEKFILQKLNYMHNNPCSGKWKLAESPIEYLHSSALFYSTGKQRLYPVKDYREFLKVDWWNE